MYGYEELVAAGKENAEAVVKSGEIAAKGFEDLAKAYAGLGLQSLEKAGGAVQALGACKTPAEFVETQAKLVRGAFDDYVAESRKLAEMTSAVMSAAAEPLASRFQAAAKAI